MGIYVLYLERGFVPRIARNPLTFGLPAHIYLLCYFSPQKGYALGKRIYQSGKNIPPTSKIYPWLDKLEGTYLQKTDNGYQAILDPLISEIKNKINSHKPLTETEETRLTEVLSSNEFRQYLEGWYNRDRKYEQYGWSEVIVGQKNEGVNALRLVAETIGMLSTVLIIREYENESYEEDEKKLEKMYRKQSKDESWIQQQMNGNKQHNAVIKYFKKFSTEFLMKLTILYPHSKIMLQTEKALFMQKYMGPEYYGWKKIE